MTYKVYTVSTATWGDKALVDPAACPWKRTHNKSAGSMQTTFRLSDAAVAATSNAGLLLPVERCLVIEFQGVVVYAGIIWEDTYDYNTKTLTISHEDVWSLLALRLISENLTGGIPSWVKTYTGLSYDTIIKRLVQLATTGAGRMIPIAFEADVAGPGARTYYGYNLDLAIDAITELMNLPGGPNVDFLPAWETGGESLRFILRTGDMNPDGQTIEAMADVPDSAIKDIQRTRSGRELASRLMGVGEGSGVDLKVRASAVIPDLAIERIEQAKNIKTLPELQEFADGKRAARDNLITQYSMALNIKSPVVGSLWTLKPGTTLKWHTSGDPEMGDGFRTNTVISYSGGITSDWVNLELQ